MSGDALELQLTCTLSKPLALVLSFYFCTLEAFCHFTFIYTFWSLFSPYKIWKWQTNLLLRSHNVWETVLGSLVQVMHRSFSLRAHLHNQWLWCCLFAMGHWKEKANYFLQYIFMVLSSNFLNLLQIFPIIYQIYQT